MKRIILLVVGALLASASALSFAANEVKLFKVQSVVSTRYGLSVQQPRFEVLVANLAYNKQVSIHLKKWDGTWIDIPLSYNRPADNGRELWTGSYSGSDDGRTYHTWDLEFAVRYVVNGVTYWDNNGGQNYKVAKDSGTYLVGSAIYDGNFVAQSYKNGNLFSSWVTVKNLGANKQVKVISSTDGWKTSRTVPASYNSNFWMFNAYSQAANPNAYGFEEWNFTVDVGTATQVEYRFEYVVNGKTYIDNNFGRNYKVSF